MSTATKAAHTSGPWTFSSFSFGSPTAPIASKKIVGPMEDGISQKLIAEIHMQHETHEADGALIAAAPEMFEALEYVLEKDRHWMRIETVRRIEAAMQKAKGAQ